MNKMYLAKKWWKEWYSNALSKERKAELLTDLDTLGIKFDELALEMMKIRNELFK